MDYKTFKTLLETHAGWMNKTEHKDYHKWEHHAKSLGYKIHRSPSFPDHAKAKDHQGNERGHFITSAGGHVLHEAWYQIKGHNVRKRTDRDSSAITSQHKDLNEPENFNLSHKDLEAKKRSAEKYKTSEHSWRRDIGRQIEKEIDYDKRTMKQFQKKKLKIVEDFVRPVGKPHTFGKFKKNETPGNKKFKVHLVGDDHEGKPLNYATTVSAFNREAAFHHAKREMIRKNPKSTNHQVDHILALD